MKKAGILFTAVMMAAGLLAGCGSPDESIQVSTVIVKPGANPEDLSWTGYIEALHSLDVTPNASGKVLAIQINEGQSVRAGDILFTLDSADVELQLKQAEASYNTAKVAASNAAAVYRENTLAAPARIARDDARENYQRLEALYEADAVSESDLNAARSRLDTAESQLKAAEINQKSSYDTTQAQMAAAAVAVEIASKRVGDCVVTAPMDGLAAKINVQIGSFVSQQSPAVTLIDDSGVLVKIQVLETDIGGITQGMAMGVYLPATGETREGTVNQIEPLGNTRTGMFEVSVLLRKGSDQPRLGLTANVSLKGGEPVNTVYVPEAGVQTAENGDAWVFIVENGILSKRDVEILAEKNAYLEVSGLNPGDEVVVSGSAALTEGAKVRVLPQGF